MFDPQTGVCSTKADIDRTRAVINECKKIEDVDKKAECFQQSQNQFRENNTNYNDSKNSARILYNSFAALNVGLALPVLIGGGLRCPALSAKLIVGSAGVNVAAEFGTNLLYKQSIKKLEKDFADVVGNIDSQNQISFNNQLLPLQKMKEQQQELIKYTKWKRGLSIAALAGYSAALVASIVEIVKLAAAPASAPVYICKGKKIPNTELKGIARVQSGGITLSSGGEKLGKALRTAGNIQQVLSLIKSAKKTTEKKKDETTYIPFHFFFPRPIYANGANGTPAAEASYFAVNKLFKNFFFNPVGRSFIAGVGVATNAFATKYHNGEVHRARRNVTLLESYMKKLTAEGNLSFCSNEDRRDPNQPHCFCYGRDAGGNIAPNFDNQENRSCQTDWRIRGFVDNPSPNPEGCIDASYQLDEACACRATNSCGNSAQFFGAAGVASLNGADAQIDAIFNGKYLDDENYERMQRYILSNTRNARVASKAIQDDGLKAKILDMADTMDSAVSSPSPFSGMGGSGGDGNMMESMQKSLADSKSPELRKIANELEQSFGRLAEIGDDGGGSPSNSGEQIAFSFPSVGAGSETSSVEVDSGEPLQSPTYNYNVNRSLRRPSQNLFDILEGRYQKSAYPKLIPR